MDIQVVATAWNLKRASGVLEAMRPFSGLVIALLVASSCGAEGDTPPSAGGPPSDESPSAPQVDPEDPCALLSPEDIERAIRADVSTEREVGSKDLVTRICSYDTAKPWSSVGVSVEDEVTAEAFNEKMTRDPPNTQKVDGIGDGAFIHGCSGIAVLVEDTQVSLGVQHLTTCEETAEVLRALANEAVEQLA